MSFVYPCQRYIFTDCLNIELMYHPSLFNSYYHNPFYMHGDIELLTQQNNSHVDGVDGNGLKMYRILDTSSNPGAFSTDNTKYQLISNIEEQLIDDSEQNEYESYIDLEAATGLGVRSRLRFGLSHSLWECDPATNEHCKLARYSDTSGKCYGSMAGSYTYPCSASNIFTPEVVGGKIIPTYWFEDHKQEVDNTEISKWTELAKEARQLALTFHALTTFGQSFMFIIGLPMILMVGMFATQREYLKHGSVNGKGGTTMTSAVSSTQKSYAGSTASSTGE